MKNLAFALLTFLLAACAVGPQPPSQPPPNPVPVKPLSSRELDVIEALLRSEYSNLIAKKAPLMVSEGTNISALFMHKTVRGRERELLEFNPDHVPRDAIRSFLTVNASTTRLGPELCERLKFVSFHRADILPLPLIFITISRVGFSRDGRLALVYCSSLINCEISVRIVVLRRVGHQWIVTPARIGLGLIS